jgi:hypothetical protein
MKHPEGIFTRVVDRLSGRAKIREYIEENIKIGNEARAVLEEAYQHVFTISLMEYAAQQERNPKDYSLQQVSARSNEDSGLVAEAEVLKNLREQMNKGGFEAIVGFQLQSTPGTSFSGPRSLSTIARGTAIKLIDPSAT